MDRFQAGKLPVPIRSIGQQLSSKSGRGKDLATQVGRWLSKLERIEIKPVIELEHGRWARVLAYQVHDGGVDLKLRIQDRRTYRAANVAQAAEAALATVPTP